MDDQVTRFCSLAEAEQHGLRFGFNADRQQFEVSADDTVVGVAHVTDRGDTRDFDHTVVSDRFRGTGLSGLLAEYALTHETTVGKRVRASCWFIERMLGRFPGARDDTGRATGLWT